MPPDWDAFEDLFRAVRPGLVRYGRTMAAPAEVDDAVQDTFLALWRRREDGGLPDRALLYAAVRNRLLNGRRDAARRREILDDMPAPPAPAPPDAVVDAALLGERVRGWLGELPERRREAFALSRFGGLSHAEVADVMGLSPKTVENHVGRALAHLRDRLYGLAPDEPRR